MAKENEINSEERYKYIGFEVFGKKTKDFWRNEPEKENYIKRFKKQLGSIYRNSVIYSSVLTLVDRIVITLVSLIMIIAPFLTWMSTGTRYGTVEFTGLTGIMNTGGFMFYVDMVEGWVIPTTIYLTTALAYLSLLFGVLTLLFLYLKTGTNEAFLKRLKMILRLQVIPFLIFLAIVIIGLIGQRIPFGDNLGIYGLSGSYSITTFVGFSSIGFWLAVFGFILNFNKSKEL